MKYFSSQDFFCCNWCRRLFFLSSTEVVKKLERSINKLYHATTPNSKTSSSFISKYHWNNLNKLLARYIIKCTICAYMYSQNTIYWFDRAGTQGPWEKWPCEIQADVMTTRPQVRGAIFQFIVVWITRTCTVAILIFSVTLGWIQPCELHATRLMLWPLDTSPGPIDHYTRAWTVEMGLASFKEASWVTSILWTD